MNGKSPAVLGLPLITPVDADRVTDEGREPDGTLHVYGGVPLAAKMEAL